MSNIDRRSRRPNILKQNKNIIDELDNLEKQKNTTFLNIGDKILSPLFGF